MDVDEDELLAFVVTAHRNGYATTSPDPADELGGKVIEYAEGDWRLVDHYYGSRAYAGLEVIHRGGDAVWAMHYHGAPTRSDVDHEPLYGFLREVLAEASSDSPYRGPDGYAADGRTYRTDADGSLGRFAGVERIETGGEPVYRGRFAGGAIE